MKMWRNLGQNSLKGGAEAALKVVADDGFGGKAAANY